MAVALPFDDSRRLTGFNLYFADVGAVLETVGVDVGPALIDEWRARVERVRAELGWSAGESVARVHARDASLAITAPLDQLFTATEVNEWALMSALYFFSPREKMPEGQMREERNGVDSRSKIEKKLPFDDEVLSFVRTLRQGSTDAERLMWSMLRGRRVLNRKFRRQHAIDPYVLDFYCHELRLAIEIDGGQHGEATAVARDAQRDAFLQQRGIATLRFWNHDVVGRTEDVLEVIWEYATLAGKPGVESNRDAFPSSALRAPSPGGGREETALHAPGHPAAWDEDSAMHTLCAYASAERDPRLMALVSAAHLRRLTVLIDDDSLSAGVGDGSRTWPITEIPDPQHVDWSALRDTPIALVTGSNGKTTTTRLLAAITRAHGWRTAYTCTDGVFVGAQALAAGDYSGPAGARVALRTPAIDMAILETARGGILRRGIAVSHANVAIVTNVSDDHFGEYGVHDLDDLAATKLAVARTLGPADVLVLNADDPLLMRHAPSARTSVHWFAFDADAPLLVARRHAGGTTCGVRGGHLRLQRGDMDHDLGDVAAMPLTFDGAARYNIANIAAAVLAADALGIAAPTIVEVLLRFGAARDDNPGRLQHWSVGGLSVFVDYAHNPDGLRGLLAVATQGRNGRLGLLLGQAGNREDEEIRELALAAAGAHPDRIVLKDIAGMLRGRVEGEVPALLRDGLARNGVGGDAVLTMLDEFQAVRVLLAWARAGDVVVLPIHGTSVKPAVGRLLDGMQQRAWTAGMPVPEA